MKASDPEQWFPQIELAGKDTFMHVRPAHATVAFELLMDAQLRLVHGSSANGGHENVVQVPKTLPEAGSTQRTC